MACSWTSKLESLRDAGLHRVTVSLDTLRPDRFRAMTRRDDHARVLAGIYAARRAGFTGTKLDAVIVRGVNDDELDRPDRVWPRQRRRGSLHRIHGCSRRHAVVHGARRFARRNAAAARTALRKDHASQRKQRGPGRALPASRRHRFRHHRLDHGARSAARCNRSRLTADGQWYRCLYATSGMDLRGPLRAGASTAELTELISAVWSARTDRGAEQRKAERFRGAFVGHRRTAARPAPRNAHPRRLAIPAVIKTTRNDSSAWRLRQEVAQIHARLHHAQ